MLVSPSKRYSPTAWLLTLFFICSFEYKINGPAVQTFDIVDGGRSPIYLIKILNNHGNQEATCVYRIQMLGDSREFQTDQGQ